jgi:hypothetical protein
MSPSLWPYTWREFLTALGIAVIVLGILYGVGVLSAGLGG